MNIIDRLDVERIGHREDDLVVTVVDRQYETAPRHALGHLSGSLTRDRVRVETHVLEGLLLGQSASDGLLIHRTLADEDLSEFAALEVLMRQRQKELLLGHHSGAHENLAEPIPRVRHRCPPGSTHITRTGARACAFTRIDGNKKTRARRHPHPLMVERV